MKNPFSNKAPAGSPIWTISAMMCLLGFMLSIAFRTNRARAAAADPDQRYRLDSMATKTDVEITKLRSEVEKLRGENTKLLAAMVKSEGPTNVMNDSLQAIKLFAGFTEVKGPGINIILSDGDEKIDAPIEERIIHDMDVLKVVNELWSAGAEAIAVDGNRVSVGTSFRCVGPTIFVDNVRIASPITIQAIGSSKDLYGAIKFPGGIHDEISSIGPNMIRIEQVERMTLPAYSGSTTRRFLKNAEAK